MVQRLFTPREVSVLRILCNPDYEGQKAMAFALGIKAGTFKLYVGQIHAKLGLRGGTSIRLVLWAIAHREELGISIPEKSRFAHPGESA